MRKREIKEIFAKRLKFYRKSKNLTQEQLAELADTTAQTISGLESKYNFPSTSLMTKLISALDVKVYEMFLDEGETIQVDDIEFQTILAQKFKSLSEDNQKIALTIIDALQEYKKTDD